MITQHGDKLIYIHGISPVGTGNPVISGSGMHRIPRNQPPTVSMISPTSGDVQTPVSLTLKAAASDADDGVAKVTFYANNQAIYTATQPPYQFPVANLTEGTHTYYAVAEDTRGATTASAPVSVGAIRVPWTPPLIPGRPGVKRQYVYDSNQQLCKVIEPETGSTVMAYDGAGNLAWSASGLALPNPTTCDQEAALTSGSRITRTYDKRSRLKTVQFPDHQGSQSWTYTASGLPQTILTTNSAPAIHGGSQVVNGYDYHRRGLLKGESVSQPGWYAWGIGYSYDRNANLQVQTYPTNLAINYAPNALGQPTQVRDQSSYTYASSVSYYPNGAVKQFTYGNGIVHSLGQNDRQLPSRVTSSGVLDNEYLYDRVGNVTTIRDLARGAYHDRMMTYDANARLRTAASLSFGGSDGGTHRFTYDKLDNVTSWTLGGVKDYSTYVYDSATQQLRNIKDSSGSTIVGFEYDTQGNLRNKNGQNYFFDLGNRLREVAGKETYRYDGHGRRVLAWEHASQANILSQYSQSGQILYQANQRINKNEENIYLAGSLIAVREWTPAGGYVAKFQHTDALGSPVAVTNQSGHVIERNEYEPYGAIIGKPNYSGVGYTGHVHDAATGLTYMQQRYYDQNVGLFLSIDPVTAHSDPVGMFNRYRYASNNPYRFTDPDGRQAAERFVEQHRRDMQAGNGHIYAPFEKPAVAITALMLLGPLAPEAYYALLARPQLVVSTGEVLAEAAGVTGVSTGLVAGAVRNVNPTRGTQNCVNCSIAVDALLAGRPASAMPGKATTIDVLASMFGRTWSKPTTISAITSEMAQAGNGARGIVYASKDGEAVGHVFNVVNQGGTVRYLDGQTGGQAKTTGWDQYRLLITGGH